MTTIDSLFKFFIPVFSRRHAPFTERGEVNDPERFIFNSLPSPCNAVAPNEDTQIDRHFYAAGTLAMFALDRPIPGEHMVPMYLLRMWSKQDRREYFKLSFKLAEGGYEVRDMPGVPAGTPRFYVFKDPGQYSECLAQVYEHSAPNPMGGERRYKYDFDPKAQGEWSTGTPMFFAITAEHGKAALNAGNADGNAAKQWAQAWIKAHGPSIGALGKTVSGDMTREQADAIAAAVTGAHPVGKLAALPKPAFYSVGVGLHAGMGLASAGIDLGAIWFAGDFPTRNPIASYSNESVTLGIGTGIDLGASVDAVFGIWFGTVDQIEGACNGVCGTVQAIGGVTITLLWTGTWEGANYTGHPIGVCVTASVGPEIGLGFFYIASATQFWRKGPNFPKQQSVNAAVDMHAPESMVGDVVEPTYHAAE